MTPTGSIVRICAPRIAKGLALPFVVAIGAAWVITLVVPRARNNPVDSAADWLHLPILLLVAATVTATIEAWPGFGRDRPERGVVDRLRPGPLGGCGTAACVGCALLLPALIALGLGFELLLARPIDRPIRTVHPLTTSDGGAIRLDRRSPDGLLSLPRSARIDTVELRPRLPLSAEGSFVPTTLSVMDRAGEPLGPERTVERTGQSVVVSFPARELTGIRLRRGERGAPLLLPPGSARASRRTAAGPALAAMIAAGSGIVAAAIGFAALILGRRHLSRGVAVTAGIALPVIGAALGSLPQSPAVRAYARDEWPLGVPTTTSGFWSLSLVVAAMLLAVVTGRPRDAA